MFGSTAAGANDLGTRIIVDSAGTPITKLIGGAYPNTNNTTITANGTVILTGLAAGTHTIKLQVYASNTTSLVCRASTQPNQENLGIQVIERKVIPTGASGTLDQAEIVQTVATSGTNGQSLLNTTQTAIT